MAMRGTAVDTIHRRRECVTFWVNENQGGSLEDFMFRRYNPTQGRWISPDPAGLSAADPANPQSWNRYAYVLNNPLSNIDPSGLDCVYLNDEGTAPENTDHASDSGECGDNGGRCLLAPPVADPCRCVWLPDVDGFAVRE